MKDRRSNHDRPRDRKRTSHAKRETLNRKRARAAKYAVQGR